MFSPPVYCLFYLFFQTEVDCNVSMCLGQFIMNNCYSDPFMFYLLYAVRPDPPYPIVESCNHNQNCIVPADTEGNLTCTLRGIYPIVELEWQLLLDDNTHVISFIHEYSQFTETTTSTADVTLTVQYKVNPSSLNRLYLVCKPKGETLEDFSRTVELLLPEGNWINPTIMNTVYEMIFKSCLLFQEMHFIF